MSERKNEKRMGLRARGGKWSWRYTLDGRPYTGATDLDATQRNRTAALAEMHAHRQAIREGRTPHRGLTARRFSDAADEYLAACRAAHRAHPSTARRIGVSFATLRQHFDGAMAGGIGAAQVEQYKVWRIEQHKVRDVTLRHDLHALSGFFQWAVRMRYAAENPVRAVKIPSDKDAVRIHVLSSAEERAYFDAAAKDQDLYDFGRLALSQGCRPAELLALVAGDVDLEHGRARIRQSKTAAGRRTLTLTAESRSILARRCAGRAPAAPIFAITASGLAKKHARILLAAGVDFCIYDLRHSFATRMAQAGCDLATLAAILGHASLRLVARYVHPTAEHQAAAMRRYEAATTAPAEAIQ